MENATPGRQNYIDWLRAGAMFLLIFYHSGRLFDDPGWHIKNDILNPVINTFNRFLDVWHMPLFFLLAGASVWFAMKRRSAGQFAGERVLRLLAPLIFGMLIIVPPQVYTERIFDGDFTGSFWSWYPHTFQGSYSYNAATGNLSWHHLWFLAYLFVFSLLLLPLFRFLSGNRGQGAINALARFMEKPWAIFTPVIPLAVINYFLRPVYGFGNQNLVNDWANFLFYITVFLMGFLLVSRDNMINTAQRNRYPALALAVLLTMVLWIGDLVAIALPESFWFIVLAAACWCWLIAIIGIGSLALNFSNRLLRYAGDAVLPVYILHQTLIVTLGYYIIRWDLDTWLKYFFVILTTLAVSLVIYEIIRRFNVTRFLFGMKWLKRQSARKSGSSPAT